MQISKTTYTEALNNLASLLDRVVNHKEAIIIKRRERGNVALIAEEELSSLLETAYLLRLPKNAARLLSAIARGKARTTEPMSVNQLCQELGIVKQAKLMSN